MSRGRRPRAHENHERWMVSYADFITLMFAFFVVMFASSQADKSRIKRVSDSVNRALEEGPATRMKEAVLQILGGTDAKGSGNSAMKGPGGTHLDSKKPPAETGLQSGELLPSLDYLSVELKKEIDSGKMHLSLEARGLVVSLRQAAFFPSGEDNIAPAMYPSLEKVATAIVKLPNPVRLEGHTDAIPIHTARFGSNWELSAARAIAVLQLLSGRFHVPRNRLAIAGYAETAPVALNDTEDGRARNRRVDIVILNQREALTEPAAAAGAARGGAAAVPSPAGKPASGSASRPQGTMGTAADIASAPA